MISATVVVVVLLSARAAVNRRAVFPAARLDANVVRVALRHRHTHTHTPSVSRPRHHSRARILASHPYRTPRPDRARRRQSINQIKSISHRDVLAPIRPRRHVCVSPPPRLASRRTNHARSGRHHTRAHLARVVVVCQSDARASSSVALQSHRRQRWHGTTARVTPHVRLGISSTPLMVFHTNRASVNTSSSINHPRRRSDRSTRERNISA